jgi:hypothetical protein
MAPVLLTVNDRSLFDAIEMPHLAIRFHLSFAV